MTDERWIENVMEAVSAARRRRDVRLAAYAEDMLQFASTLPDVVQNDATADRSVDEADGIGTAGGSGKRTTRRAPSPTLSSRLPHFDRLLTLTGIRDPKKLADENGQWELWSAQEPDRFTGATRTLGVILLLNSATEERLRAIEASMPGKLPRSTPLTFVIAPRVNARDAYEAIKAWHREATIVSIPQLLRNVHNRLVRPVTRPFPAELASFVDPGITIGGRASESTIDTLSEFLTHDWGGGIVGVLLGSAGAGKSTVALELCRPPKEGGGGTAATLDMFDSTMDVPRLLVEDNHWVDLEKQGVTITADAVLKAALRANGFARDDLDQLDVLLSNGAMTLVFDSFDEVCSHGTRTSPNEILERILSLAELENSGARVLITTRPEFWARVDESLREQCITFTLLPFDDARSDTLLDRRFANDQVTRNRARNVLHKLSPEVRAIPLVVSSIADAVAEGVDMVAFLEQTASGIKRSNPLPGVARIMFARETEKHGIPLSADDQAKFFALLVGEYGLSFTDDELIDAALVEFQSLTPTEAAKLRDHFMLWQTPDALPLRYSIKHPELAQALVADATVGLLRELATGSITPKHAVALRQFLTRAAIDFPTIIDRIGLDLQRLTGSEQERIWEHRVHLRTFVDAQSTLFRVLVEAQKPDSAGYRTPTFLPSDGSFQIATDYVQKGNLRKVDLRAVRFSNVQFRDVEIASCVFSAVSAFTKCVFINCAIGRDCEGLYPEAFLTAHCDEKTIAQSKRWLLFPDVRPDVLAKVALQRVVFRVIRAAGDTAFALGSVIAEDSLEEHVVEVLKRLYVIKEAPWPIIDTKHVDAARKLVRNGEMIGAFQHAFRDVATWTSRDWRSTNH